MKKNLLIALLTTASISCSLNSMAADRATLTNYYSSLKGLKKEALKTALHNLLKDHTVIPYGGRGNGTWKAFYKTDRLSNGEVLNRYSPEKFSFSGDNGKAVAGMNIEHSFPKSWWGGAQNDAYKDINHLYPSSSKDNSQKSNYPMAIVTTIKHNSGEGYDKVGTAIIDGREQQCWEPGDTWKGDFARSYMYMATTYQNLNYVATGAVTLTTGSYPTLKQWASTLYRSWSKADKVSQIETQRNDVVYSIQHNRNAFIDYPFLAEYIWGDSVDVAFDPAKAVTTASDDPRYGQFKPTELPSVTPTDPSNNNNNATSDVEGVIYDANFNETNASFNIVTTKSDPAVKNVWRWDSKYKCFKGSGHGTSADYAVEASLVTPEIDLANTANVKLEFKHSHKFGKNHDNLKVFVEADGQKEEVNIPKWGTGNDWKFVDAGDISLEKYVGKKIKIYIAYMSTADNCPGWEVKDLRVVGTRKGGTAPEQPSVEPQPSNDGVIYDAQFDENWKTFERVEPKLIPGTKGLWYYETKYHYYKASGYYSKDKTKHETLGTLKTPEIDFANTSELFLTFKSAINKGTKEAVKVQVEVDGQAEDLAIDNFGTGTSWDFVDVKVSLEKYVGKKVKIAFVYASTTQNTPTWEIKDLKVLGQRTTTAIEEVKELQLEQPNFNQPYQIYTVNGVRLNNDNNYKGLVIIKQNGKTWKLFKK